MKRTLSEQHKTKLSQALKGRKVSVETRKKISMGLTGIKRSEQHRKNLSKALMGKKLSEETKRKIGLLKTGIKHSLEEIEKIRLGNLGKKLSQETKRKISEWHCKNSIWLGKRMPEESNEKKSASLLL